MEIPNWSNMPDGMSLAILSWEDVYIKACDELERNPTRDEILEIFDDMSKSMRNITQDGMPAQLDALITEIVTECLKSKPYDPHSMTDEELTSKNTVTNAKRFKRHFGK